MLVSVPQPQTGGHEHDYVTKNLDLGKEGTASNFQEPKTEEYVSTVGFG